MVQCYTFHRYFIPGHGCGNYENEVKFMEKLPEGFEELKKLKCVSTPDYHGFQRWKMIRRSSFEKLKVICFIYNNNTIYILEWETVQPWSQCSASCNGGFKYKIRQCRNGTHVLDPEECGNSVTNVTRSCNSHMCPGMLPKHTYFFLQIGTKSRDIPIDYLKKIMGKEINYFEHFFGLRFVYRID